MEGSAYAWEQFCNRHSIEPDGLPIKLVAEHLRPTVGGEDE